MENFNPSSTVEFDTPFDVLDTQASSESLTPQTFQELSQQAQTGEDLAVEPEITSPQDTNLDTSEAENENDNEIEPSANANKRGTVLFLKAKQIRFDEDPHRIYEEFSSSHFGKLTNDILRTGANVEPIVVRLVAGVIGEPDAKYELIYGHRRLKACDDHGLDVWAIVVHAPRSQSFALDRVKSNLLHKTMSPYESGRQMRRILEDGEFDSDASLAKAIGASKSKVSRELNLANLPDVVISAFVDPRKLRVLDGPDLAKAVTQNRAAVEAEAIAIAADIKRPDEREVVKRLLEAANLISSVARRNNARNLIVNGQVVGNWTVGKDDDIQVKLTVPLPPHAHARVMAKFQKLLGAYVEIKLTSNNDDDPDSNDTDDASQTT